MSGGAATTTIVAYLEIFRFDPVAIEFVFPKRAVARIGRQKGTPFRSVAVRILQARPRIITVRQMRRLARAPDWESQMSKKTVEVAECSDV